MFGAGVAGVDEYAVTQYFPKLLGLKNINFLYKYVYELLGCLEGVCLFVDQISLGQAFLEALVFRRSALNFQEKDLVDFLYLLL